MQRKRVLAATVSLIIQSSVLWAIEIKPASLTWISPQVLTHESIVKFDYELNRGARGNETLCIYLSLDTVFDPDEDQLLFSTTISQEMVAGMDVNPAALEELPAPGNYYVFLQVKSNSIMANRIVTVAEKSVTEAVVFTLPQTGQALVAAGYSDGTLEFLDWNGNVLATRTDLGRIYKLGVKATGTDPVPHLFVASACDNGSIRIVDLNDIDVDLAVRGNFGKITAMDVWGSWRRVVYVGAEGILWSLNASTLEDNVPPREGMAFISEITRAWSGFGDYVVVATEHDFRHRSNNRSNNHPVPTLHYLNTEDLADAIAPQNVSLDPTFGVTGLASADVDRDGQSELAFVADSGRRAELKLVEAPYFNEIHFSKKLPGSCISVDYSMLNCEQTSDNTPLAAIGIALEHVGGSVCALQIGVDSQTDEFDVVHSSMALENTDIYLLQFQDYYMNGKKLLGAMIADQYGLSFRKMDILLME